MKSNEEFIAGIYEKAAVYKEESTVTSEEAARKKRLTRVTKIAAMVAVCVGLAGVSAMTFGKGRNQTDDMGQTTQEYGIALTSEQSEEMDGAKRQFRMIPVAETATFTGVVESVDLEEKRIWLKLEFEEDAPKEYEEGSMVCIYWDLSENIRPEVVPGVRLRVTGALSVYENEASKQYGCAELVLTDIKNLWQWMEEDSDFRNYAE